MGVGRKFLCMMCVCISWLFISVGKWSVRNPFESLGETN